MRILVSATSINPLALRKIYLLFSYKRRVSFNEVLGLSLKWPWARYGELGRQRCESRPQHSSAQNGALSQ